MSLSALIVKILGLVLAIVGTALLLSSVGINFLGVGFSPVWAQILIGFIFLMLGVYLLEGNKINL